LIYEPILVPHRKGVGDPHPDILIGADRLVGASVDLGELSGQPPCRCCTVVTPEAIISKAE
jgi:hypothetical protein